MKRLVFVCCCVLMLGLSGCAPTTPDSLFKSQISLLNEYAVALENDAPQAKMDELKARGEAIGKQFEALKLSEEEKQKLLERHKEELMPVVERLQKAMLTKAAKGFGGGGIPGFMKPGGK